MNPQMDRRWAIYAPTMLEKHIVFVVDGSRQTLAGSLPNTFFPQVMMLIELIAYEYRRLCMENGIK